MHTAVGNFDYFGNYDSRRVPKLPNRRGVSVGRPLSGPIRRVEATVRQRLLTCCRRLTSVRGVRRVSFGRTQEIPRIYTITCNFLSVAIVDLFGVHGVEFDPTGALVDAVGAVVPTVAAEVVDDLLGGPVLPLYEHGGGAFESPIRNAGVPRTK